MAGYGVQAEEALRELKASMGQGDPDSAPRNADAAAESRPEPSAPAAGIDPRVKRAAGSETSVEDELAELKRRMGRDSPQK